VGPTYQPSTERGKGGARWGVSREGGGNRAGRHRRVVGQAGPAERPRPHGERESGQLGEGKGMWATAGPKIGAGPNSSNKFISIFIWNSNFWQLWKFVQGDLEGILTWEFFLNSSRLLKDFRKI
jgi:hypothetical protein